MSDAIKTIESIHPLNRDVHSEALEFGCLSRVKAAYSTRRIELGDASLLLSGSLKPQAGDLVLARIKRLRQHTRIELASGRRARLYEGDEVLLCYANRYAPDQFEAVVPDDLSACHMVAAGGVAAKMLNKHSKMKGATQIEPIGLLARADGSRLNLADYAIEQRQPSGQVPVVAVLGTSMNAGKTTTAANLVKGLDRAGFCVGAAKVTGTGAGCDTWFMIDSGAGRVLDFTDAGLASTFRVDPQTIENTLQSLVAELEHSGADVIVLEIADGLFQQETSALLASPVFQQTVDYLLFAAGDAMGALAGSQHLAAHPLPLLAVSGALTASPLAVTEAQAALDVPVLGSAELTDARTAASLICEPAVAAQAVAGIG